MKILERSIYKDSRSAYLIIKPESDINNSLSFKMLKNNSIKSLLDMECRNIDNNMELYYEIYGMQCMKEYIVCFGIDYFTIKQLYKDIVQAVLIGEEFLLSEDSYILDLEYIYWDKKSKSAKLCCVPGMKGDFQSNIKKLTEEIITFINHKDNVLAGFMYGIYDLIIDRGFIVADIKTYIKEYRLDTNGEIKIASNNSAIRGKYYSNIDSRESVEERDIKKNHNNKGVKDKSCENQEYERGAENRKIENKEIRNKEVENKETKNICTKVEKSKFNNDSIKESITSADEIQKEGMIEDINAGVVYGICIAAEMFPWKQGKKNDEVIWFNEIYDENMEEKSELYVGRFEDCDIILPFSQVSGYHAKIYIGKNLYIEDINSTNGTYMNGQRISADEKSILGENDVIIFADIPCRILCK